MYGLASSGSGWAMQQLGFHTVFPSALRERGDRGRCLGPVGRGSTADTLAYLLLSIVVNRLFSDSARVGCAKMPSRKAVYGSLPIIAISRADMISPRLMPRIVAPKI